MDELSEEEAAGALVIVERGRADPMIQALARAASDDELSSPHEDDSARQALLAYERGETLSAGEVKRDLGKVVRTTADRCPRSREGANFSPSGPL